MCLPWEIFEDTEDHTKEGQLALTSQGENAGGEAQGLSVPGHSLHMHRVLRFYVPSTLTPYMRQI